MNCFSFEIGSPLKRLRWPSLSLPIHLLFVFVTLSQQPLRAGEIELEVKPIVNLAYYKATGLTGSLQINRNDIVTQLNIPGPGPLTGELPKVALTFDFTVSPSSITPDNLLPWLNPDHTFAFMTDISLSINLYLLSGTTTFEYNLPALQFTTSVNEIPVDADWLLVDSNNGEDAWIQMKLTNTPNGIEGYLAYVTTDTSAAEEYAANGGELGDGLSVIVGGAGSISYTAVPELGSFGITGLGLGVVLVGYALRRRLA